MTVPKKIFALGNSEITETFIPEKQIWLLQHLGSKFGPLTKDEVESIVKSQRLKGPIYVSRAGTDNWNLVEETQDFAHLYSEEGLTPFAWIGNFNSRFGRP